MYYEIIIRTKKYITGVSKGHLYPEDMAILEKI